MGEKEKKLNKKKVIIVSLIILAIIGIIITISFYISEKQFREWIDVHILRKNITEEDISVINLNIDKNNQVHVYNKYIAILNDKAVKLYNNYGEEVGNIAVNINTALFDSNDKYLAIAEDRGNEVSLIFDKTYLWSTTLEGEILQVHVNQNGYVAVITTDTTYKSIINLYDSSGKQLFRRFFASTRIIDASISKDNKYIAVGELDSSGALIQSNVEIISIENAQRDAENTIIYAYKADSGTLITNVEYQAKGQIACMYDNAINIINNEENTELVKLDEKDIIYASVDLNNSAIYLKEETAGIFKTNSNINILNTQNSQSNLYILEDIAKEVYTKGDIIAINVGTELYFINVNGWLIKKYTGSQEITNVMFSNNLAAIVYKDKVIIIDL